MINPIIWSSHLGILVFIYGTNLLIYWNGTLSDNLKWIKMLKINNCTLNSSSFVFNGSFLNTIGKPKSLVYWFLALGSLLRLNDIQKRCHFRQLSEQSTRENKVVFFKIFKETLLIQKIESNMRLIFISYTLDYVFSF